jgi:hypothetical protein
VAAFKLDERTVLSWQKRAGGNANGCMSNWLNNRVIWVRCKPLSVVSCPLSVVRLTDGYGPLTTDYGQARIETVS